MEAKQILKQITRLQLSGSYQDRKHIAKLKEQLSAIRKENKERTNQVGTQQTTLF